MYKYGLSHFKKKHAISVSLYSVSVRSPHGYM